MAQQFRLVNYYNLHRFVQWDFLETTNECFLGANSPVQGDDGGDFNIGNCWKLPQVWPNYPLVNKHNYGKS